MKEKEKYKIIQSIRREKMKIKEKSTSNKLSLVILANLKDHG